MIDRRPLEIGSRGSELALVQANLVRDALAAVGQTADVRVIVTEGDIRAPDTAWGEGAFVGAIERSLLDGDVDLAVHSAKDVPTDEDPRLRIAAFLPRADPRDVVVFPVPGKGSLHDLPLGARVGTDSPRRASFLRAARPDVRVLPLHGNVDTRLRRLDAGEADALVLAAAGLERLGRGDRANVVLDPAVVPPAPGQGALAVQIRRDDVRAVAAVARLDDLDTRHAVEVERAILAGAGGGCRAPLGALARVHGATLSVATGYARPEGDVVVRAEGSGPVTDRARLVDAVLADLARSAVAAAVGHGWPEVIVTRPDRESAGLLLSLVDAGLAPRPIPTIEVELCTSRALDDAVADLGSYTWVVLTSANAVRAIDATARRLGVDLAGHSTGRGARPRWAVVGRATARQLTLLGVEADVRPRATDENAAALARLLAVGPGDTVLLPRSSLASPELPAVLRRGGATVDDVTAYETSLAPSGSQPLLEASIGRRPRAVVISSPSAVRGLIELAEHLGAVEPVRALPIVVPGSTTAAAVRSAGFDTVHVAESPSPTDVATATRRAVTAHQEIRG